MKTLHSNIRLTNSYLLKLSASMFIILVLSNCSGQKKNLTNKYSARIAPIFEHGSGKGFMGQRGGTKYLSYTEAMDIINEELLKEGIIFNDKYEGDSLKIEKEIIKIKVQMNSPIDEFDTTIVELPFYPISYNKELSMILVFVDINACKKYENSSEDIISWSGGDYEIKDVAKKIRTSLQKNGKYNAVVFYDPVYRYSNEKPDAIMELKLQVSDFIEWLKKENINPLR